MTNSLGLMIVVDTNGVCEKSVEEGHFSSIHHQMISYIFSKLN